jgi:hypothetical protein
MTFALLLTHCHKTSVLGLQQKIVKKLTTDIFFRSSDNSSLAIYYLLVVKFGVSEERLRYNIEPAMHLMAVAFGLISATAGVFLDLYNNASLWCWIAPFPVGCEDSRSDGETTCIRGVNSWIYR